MASNDKLWFELGVRENVTRVLTQLLKESKDVEESFDKMSVSIDKILDSAYKKSGKVNEYIGKLNEKIEEITKKDHKVKIEVVSDAKSVLTKIEDNISELTQQLDVLGKSINKTLSLQSANPNDKHLSAGLEQLTNAYKDTETQLYALYETHKKLSSTGIFDATKSLGLEPVEEKWNSKETRAEQHLKRQREIEAAFAEEEKNQLRVEEILQMRRHKNHMQEAADEREIAAIANQVNREVTEKKERRIAAEKRNADAIRKTKEAEKQAAQAARELGNANHNLMQVYEQVAKASEKNNRILQQMNNQIASYFSIYSAERFLKNIITIGGQFEYQHRALQNILGDIQEANTLFSQLQGLAVESPKTFMELTNYVKQLSAYQIPASELFDTTRRLADISSGLGVDMSRLILAYGQVRSAAVLRGQELRQFTEAGIPIVQALADKFTEMNGKLTTTADVFKLISQRAVPFEMVKEILWDMTNQGGKFYNMQSELADTLYGKWQKLQDTWQIMLGHIADGGSLAGKTLKGLIEGVVALTRSFDVLIPLIGGVALANLNKNIFTGLYKKYSSLTDSGAIRNMEIAKQRQAAILEKERVMYGRQLTSTEKELIRNKNVLTSQDYALLAVENAITDKKAYQLMLDGKMKREDFERLLIAKQYTAEQRSQILGGNTNLLKGGNALSKIGRNIWGFIGGWPGAITTAVGAAFSAYNYFSQKSEELSQKGDAMMSHAEQGANNIAKAINNVSADSTMEKKIESLESSLLQLGSTGEAIVAKSRSNMDDINERWKLLKEGAEDYKKTLELLGNQQGKALFEKSLEDSGIENNIKSYDNAVNEMYKTQGLLKHYDEIYKLAIKNITDNNEKLRDAISGKNIFEQIEIVGQKKIYNELFINRNNQYGALSPSAISALNVYFNKLRNIDNTWKDITNNSIPKMADALKAIAESRGITNFKNLSDENKRTLETIVREYANSIQNASVDAKNKLAEELASHVFNIEIVGNLKVDTTEMSGFANYVWNKFGAGGVLKDKGNIRIGKSVFTKAQVSNIFKDVDSFTKNINKEIDDLEITKKRLQKLPNSEQLVAETQSQIDEKLSVVNALNLRENKNKGGRNTDERLKRWKEEWSELKAFYAEFKKWAQQIGDDKALEKLRSTGLWGQFFNADGSSRYDMTDWGKAIADYSKQLKGGTVERDKHIFEVNKEMLTPAYDQMKQIADSMLNQLDKALKEQGKRWDLYKKILDATGNRQQASTIAFGGSIAFDNQAQELRSQLNEALAKNDKAKGKTIDELLGMDGKALRNIGIFKENTDGVYQKLERLREVEQALKADDVELFLDAIKNAKSLETELAQIELKYERTRKAIRDNGGDSSLLANADREESREKANTEWEWFKKNTEGWGEMFSSLDRMTTSAIDNMISALERQIPKIQASEEAMKALYQALDKLRDEKMERNPFAALSSSISRASSIRKLLASGFQSGNFSAKMAQKYGVQAGRVTREDLQKSLKGAEKDLPKAITGIASKFQALQKVMQPAIDLFDSLGESGISDMLSVGSDMFSSAAGVAEGMNSLKDLFGEDSGIGKALGAAGPYAAAAGAAMSMVSGIFALHDKALQEEIDASKARQEEMENLAKNLEKAIERALGGIYNAEISSYSKELLKNRTNYLFGKAILSKKLSSIGLGEGDSEEYLKEILAINKALEDNNVYEAQRYALQSQIDEVKRQLELEEDKKDPDDSAIASYKQQIAELDDEVKNFAIDMAKALYDIDLKSWSQELTDAIVSAWENGENAAEAYTKKVKSLMKDLTKNILAQKVLEQAFKNAGIDQMIANMMDATSGKLNYGNVGEIADALFAVGETSANAITAILDEMERKGYIEKGGESSTSSKVIQGGFTENETGLVLSYLNAMRADVSIQRADVFGIRQFLEGNFSQMPVIAQAQLQQLQQISVNTGKNAGLVEQIYSLLHRLAPDGQSIRVS